MLSAERLAEDKLFWKIHRLLSDKYTLKILRNSQERPVSRTELSNHCNIPYATCCRRTSELEELGLLEITERGFRQDTFDYNKLYLSLVDNFDIYTENGSLTIRINLKYFNDEYSSNMVYIREDLAVEMPRIVYRKCKGKEGKEHENLFNIIDRGNT